MILDYVEINPERVKFFRIGGKVYEVDGWERVKDKKHWKIDRSKFRAKQIGAWCYRRNIWKQYEGNSILFKYPLEISKTVEYKLFRSRDEMKEELSIFANQQNQIV